MLTNLICLWAGAVVDIPSGFALCDGTNGTPDLRGKFIAGAGDAYDVGDVGGSDTQTHAIDITSGNESGQPSASAGGGYAVASSDHTHEITGNTGSADNRPAFYALCYIKKL